MSSRNRPSDTKALASGTYVIWSSDHESLMAPKRARNSNHTFVVTEDTPPFQWDVLFDNSKQRYSIQIHKRKSYIVTQGTDVLLADQAQFYDITTKSQTADGEVYYEIRTTDDRLFQHNSDKQSTITNTKVPDEVTAEKNATSTLGPTTHWVFEELSGDITPSPYSIYSKNSDYFEYSEKHRLLPRFGLIDDSADRWPTFWKDIRQLNADANGSVIYKVLFLARHGQAINNINIKSLTNDGDLEWDPMLTQEGYFQASKIEDMWKEENSLKEGGIGIPQISYCSPLTRCLVTNSITFTPQLAANGGPEIHTVVVEDCRELVYKSEGERRRSKEYIELVFPKFVIDPVFADQDPLWTGTSTESEESVEYRARAVLDKIFKEPDWKIFVSITGHHEMNGAIISALGGCPGAYPRHHGGVVPIICQYSPTPGALDSGFYKIEYIPEPARFADAIRTNERVMAFDRKIHEPTTWFVKCVDAKEQVYVINYFRVQLHGMQKPKLYWNTPHNSEVSTTRSEFKQNSDVPVILSLEKRGWRLIPSGEAGVYYIEWTNQNQPAAPSNTNAGSDTVTLVTVETSSNVKDEPLVLRKASGIVPGAPRWKFIPVKFPKGFNLVDQ